jgi:CheY-like chemotaxis protein
MACNILVVDDSAVMRAMILKALRLSDLPFGEVHEAATGEAALQILEQQQNPETAALPVIVVSTEGSETRIAAGDDVPPAAETQIVLEHGLVALQLFADHTTVPSLEEQYA